MKAKMYVSTGDIRKAPQTAPLKFVPDDGTEEHVINLYPSDTDQTLEGFGGAITDAAGYVFSKMTPGQQEELLDMYFSPDRMRYEKVRVHMDSCDFSTHVYSAVEEDNGDILGAFSFRETERYILPLLEAGQKKAGKKLKLMLSPWSAPAFMKTNGSRLHGGSIKPEYRKAWAQYLCRYIREFRDRGYEVERISVQNEPKAVQTWDSCVYTAEEEKEFLRDDLYPAMQENGMGDVQVFIWDHNKERLYERVRGILDETTDPMVTGAAFHWYSGDHFEALDLVRRRYPGKKLILSESCLELYKYGMNKEQENAERLAHDMIGNLNHGMEAFYDWNILLDSQGGPNHVGNFCDAPYLYDLEAGKLMERDILRYYWHFTHFIQPKAQRIAHTRYTDKLDVTAWKNPGGELVWVVLNRSEEDLECVFRLDGSLCRMTMPAHSIASFVGGEE